MSDVNPSIGSLVVGLIVVGAILSPLEWWRPAVPAQPRWRRDAITDLAYWIFTPLVSGTLARADYVVASPAFHRWHHARETDGDGRNFAGLFPSIDAVFGTLYLPRVQPTAFGIVGDPVPRGLLAQLRYPFMRRTA